MGVGYTPGSGATVAADTVNSELYQRVKSGLGAATTLQTIAASGAAATATAVNCPGVGTVQATVSGTGTVTATVAVEVSNDNTNFVTLGTITLSGTTSATDGFAFAAPWVYIRSNCTAISGTNAALSVVMGA